MSSLNQGRYKLGHITYDLRRMIEYTRANTQFYPESSELAQWSAQPGGSPRSPKVQICISPHSTLAAARSLHDWLVAIRESPSGNDYNLDSRIGVLNFGNATTPGHYFLEGAEGQEQSLARSSTLYPSLTSDNGFQFYATHRDVNTYSEGDPRWIEFYTHGMIYSPNIVLMRDDGGNWLAPVEVDVVTSCAVNAGAVRRQSRLGGRAADEAAIERVMKERMARILYLFEKKGVRNLVLGAYGTGAFQNSVELVASTWAELLLLDFARFRYSFDQVIFAVTGEGSVHTFKEVFGRCSGGATVIYKWQ